MITNEIEPKIFHEEEGKLDLATFSLCELSGRSYDRLKFLCKIWGMESVFDNYCFPKRHFRFPRGCEEDKNEVVVRLRAKMRREENRRKLYRRRFPIETPESIKKKSISGDEFDSTLHTKLKKIGVQVIVIEYN